MKLAVVPVVERSVEGPKTHRVYHFRPWAEVADEDVPGMTSTFIKRGCNCGSGAKTIPFFATEAEIMSGKVVPDWAGQHGAPAITR